jgi:steroid 5-alpha reductase family enzyme
VLLVLMVMAWVASLRLPREAPVADVAFGIGLAAVAFICFALGEGDARRLALATGIGFATGVALALRPRGAWRVGGDPLVALWRVFLAAGFVALVASLPVHGAAGSHDALGALDYIGALVWLTGALALRAVWFGEPLAWWGLYAIALAGGAWWALPAPVLMTALALRRRT